MRLFYYIFYEILWLLDNNLSQSSLLILLYNQFIWKIKVCFTRQPLQAHHKLDSIDLTNINPY